ncbi:MAG: transcription elongation factor GreA [Solirubrobacterales bacterium]
MNENKTSGESITAEGLVALKADIAEMEGSGRELISDRLKVARAMGDLKENAEYHIAKEDQAHLETRIQRARERLRDAVVVQVDEASAETFSFGRTAIITDSEGREHAWTLVGSTEASLSEGRLSAESPVGQALRNRSVGQEVEVSTPKGPRLFTISRMA